ncbi:hypothetical protein G7Z17_g13706 [Cylindrodendrum hubeiense]|uniref:Uncharacterized protein n=1 Tax=Cylindrodendrum hubeiense TaxID=595255 RepID=A0A9P5GWI3_9HYPO|nr:hypothetical protein G7Z17_g13706 [Cylindrodendrum hubeiense]
MSSSPSSSAHKSGLNSELESFRRQWISDLQHQTHDNDHDHDHESQSQSRHDGPRRRRPSVPVPAPAAKPVPAIDENEDDYIQSQSFDEPAPAPQAVHGVHGVSTQKKLVSALDFYEEAMTKETQGNMGDSLKLYRQAYRVCTVSRFCLPGPNADLALAAG